MKAFLLIGALCIGAGAARADEAQKPDRPVRVGASHRVDVIAPGERVETVLDRMRAARNPTTAPNAAQPTQRPVRGPEGGREHDGHGPPPGAPPRAPGGAPPGPASGGPPSERPHR